MFHCHHSLYAFRKYMYITSQWNIVSQEMNTSQANLLSISKLPTHCIPLSTHSHIMLNGLFTNCDIGLVSSYLGVNRDGYHMWGRTCSLFPEHMISLPLGSSWFHPFIVYALYITEFVSLGFDPSSLGPLKIGHWVIIIIWYSGDNM